MNKKELLQLLKVSFLLSFKCFSYATIASVSSFLLYSSDGTKYIDEDTIEIVWQIIFWSLFVKGIYTKFKDDNE